MMKQKHSPLPWKDDCLVRGYILDAYDNLICACSSYEIARFIVQAYNNYDEMREAMQQVVDKVEAGVYRSTYTYGKFKRILARLEAEE